MAARALTARVKRERAIFLIQTTCKVNADGQTWKENI